MFVKTAQWRWDAGVENIGVSMTISFDDGCVGGQGYLGMVVRTRPGMFGPFSTRRFDKLTHNLGASLLTVDITVEASGLWCATYK